MSLAEQMMEANIEDDEKKITPLVTFNKGYFQLSTEQGKASVWVSEIEGEPKLST